MADDLLGLADMTTVNDANLADIFVSDLLQDAPFLAASSAVPASNGELHKYIKTTGAPTVGFRSVNDGREHDSSVRTAVSITLKLLDASWHADKALLRLYKGGMDAMAEIELQEHLRAAFFKLEQQILGGVDEGDAAGFAGLADSAQLDAIADPMVLSAGGSTALSSVYMVRGGRNDFVVVAGNDGNIDVGAPVEQQVDGTTGHFTAITQSVLGWYGVQVGSAYSVARLCNLDAGSNTLDDDSLFQLLELFPAGRGPTQIVMSRRSQYQLRASRTATNPTGVPAPLASTWEGIPIIVTDGIGNAETAIT